MIGSAIFFQEDFFHAYHTGDSRICFGRCSCAGGTCGSISARLFSAAEKIRILRQTVYFVLGVCVLVILCATLTGRIVPPSERSRNLVPFRMFTEPWLMGREKKITQIIANIVMFAPPGMLLPMAFLSVRRFWKTAAAMGAFSFIIEFIQYFIGRQADIDDFMLNAAGGMLGYLIFALCKKLWKEKKIWKSLIEKNGISVDRKRRSS